MSGRCYACCMENCGYGRHCSCSCHDGESRAPCSTCGEPSGFTNIAKCRKCAAVEDGLSAYINRGKQKARAFIRRALKPKTSTTKKTR